MTSVRLHSQLSEEFEVEVGMHLGSVLSQFLFAVVVDVVTEFARKCALSETIEGLRIRFMRWKEAFESKGLKDSLLRPP